MMTVWSGAVATGIIRMFRELRALSEREAAFLLFEFAQFRGLMPLLARACANGAQSTSDRAALREHLRRMSSLSPYLLIAVLPGSFLALPLVAMWRDRRRNRIA
jgi:hypothetical protein